MGTRIFECVIRKSKEKTWEPAYESAIVGSFPEKIENPFEPCQDAISIFLAWAAIITVLITHRAGFAVRMRRSLRKVVPGRKSSFALTVWIAHC